MVACSTDFDPEVDEFEIAGLTKKISNKINDPRETGKTMRRHG